MLKRNVILGGLIAGAFLLPSVASAGKVKGVCSNCHTMHDSQNGNVVNTGAYAGQHAQLLKGDGCNGCHADAAADNIAVSGKGTGPTGAPQVDAATQTNAGGYFSSAAAKANQHDIAGISTKDTNMGNRIPGGSATGYTQALTCGSCHTQAGHHSTTNTYRMLSGSNQATSGAGTYNPGSATLGDRSSVTYSTNMNTVCANCHSSFHGTSNTGNTSGAFTRHPTGNLITNGASTPVGITLTDAIVASSDSKVLCLSCHVAHGGPNADLLSFVYGGSGSYAGDASATGDGCETCHSYSGGGM